MKKFFALSIASLLSISAFALDINDHGVRVGNATSLAQQN